MVRWVNTVAKPLPHAGPFIRFVSRYPFLFLIVAALCGGLGAFFYRALSRFEEGQTTSVYVGELQLLYRMFGKWGIVGFFSFLVLCWLYLFWVYAIRELD